MSDKVQIYRPGDVIEPMVQSLLKGKVKGTTTYNKFMDECWTWKAQEANIWTGYSNEGKSLMIRQASTIKALEENKRFLFCAPEDFPPEDFFDDIIHTISGTTTDKDYPNVISEANYRACLDLIKDKFIFVYMKPPGNTIERVLQEFEKICLEEEIFGCIIDPLIKFERPKGIDRDDLYANSVGSLAVDFCRRTNTSFHLVMHQLTPKMEGPIKKYPEPSMYTVKGGGSWSDGFDNVLSVWRPNYATDKFDTEVQFASQKIKKQKLVGIPQRMKISFSRKMNRYTEYGTEKPLFDFDKFYDQIKTK